MRLNQHAGEQTKRKADNSKIEFFKLTLGKFYTDRTLEVNLLHR